ncbi:MAG: HD domain-containing phosphohydrolase [Pseudonocardia sp.]
MPAPYSDLDWERVRMHAYHTERLLSRSALAPIGALASLHHEQPCGSGYHRSLPGPQLPVPALLLAAADTVQPLGQPCAWRPALAPPAVAETARAMAEAGRLDRTATEAVLDAAGAASAGVPRRRPDNPAGVTDREVDVVRVLGLFGRCGGRDLGGRRPSAARRRSQRGWPYGGDRGRDRSMALPPSRLEE